MTRVWAGEVAGAVLPLVEDWWVWGSEVDELLGEDETPLVVTVGYIISQVLAAHGVRVPDEDQGLLRWVTRRHRPVPRWTRWSLVELPTGRLGVVAPHGVVETAGESLVLVTHRQESRAVEFWPVPGVLYPGVTVKGGGL